MTGLGHQSPSHQPDRHAGCPSLVGARPDGSALANWIEPSHWTRRECPVGPARRRGRVMGFAARVPNSASRGGRHSVTGLGTLASVAVRV